MMSLRIPFIFRLKAWQLFLGLFVVPMVVMVVIMARMLATQDLYRLLPLCLAVNAAWGLVVIWWFYETAVALNKITLPKLHRPTRLMAMCCLGSAAILLIITGLTIFVARGTNPPGFIGFIIFMMLIVDFGAMIYMLYFTASNLVHVERGEAASFSEYAAEFFLLVFWPIGVWVLQPRISKAGEKRHGESRPGSLL